jgi:hypothetical protein
VIANCWQVLMEPAGEQFGPLIGEMRQGDVALNSSESRRQSQRMMSNCHTQKRCACKPVRTGPQAASLGCQYYGF